VKRRHDAASVAQYGECIVLELAERPDRGLRHRVHVTRHPDEPVQQVDDVDALIGELAAAGEFGVAAPLTFVSRAPAVTVADARIDRVPIVPLDSSRCARAIAGW